MFIHAIAFVEYQICSVLKSRAIVAQEIERFTTIVITWYSWLVYSDSSLKITLLAEDIRCYSKFLPVYFPRSLKEEIDNLPNVPADIGSIQLFICASSFHISTTGDVDGEPVVEERKIRIDLIRPVGKNPLFSHSSFTML